MHVKGLLRFFMSLGFEVGLSKEEGHRKQMAFCKIAII